MATISKPAGGSFTIVGSLKNVGTLDLNCWAATKLTGTGGDATYAASATFPLAVGATAAIPFANGGIYIIPQNLAAGNYSVHILVGDNTTPFPTSFQEVDTGWIITVAAGVKSVEAVSVTVS